MLPKVLFGGLLATMAAIGSANALLIDDFNNPVLGTNVNNFTQTTCPTAHCSSTNAFTGAGIVGGTRSLQTTVNGLDPNMSPAQWSVQALVSNGGAFSHSQTTGVASHTKVVWNKNGAGLNADLTADGSIAFLLDVVAADLAAQWDLSVTDAGGHTATDTFGTGGNISNFLLTVPFSAFTGINPALDLHHISEIDFVANSTDDFAFDTRVDALATVAEPAGILVLGIGLAGMAALPRLRRRQTS